MLESQLRQYPPYREISGSVERSVNDLDRIGHSLNYLGMNDLLLEFDHILVIDFFSDHIVELVRYGFFLAHCFNFVVIGNSCNFTDNIRISGGCDLSTVFPINFVSVIFRRIMTCGYDYSGSTSESTKCK